MRLSAIWCLALSLSACGAPAEVWHESSSVELAADAQETEETSSHEPPQAIDCIGLSPEYVDWFGEFGLLTAEQVADQWSEATGYDRIAVVLDGSCPLQVTRGEVSKKNGGGFYRPSANRITLSDSVGMWECNERVHTSLATVLSHELGHAFGCGHQARGLMRSSPNPCDPTIDELAASCATRLTHR